MEAATNTAPESLGEKASAIRRGYADGEDKPLGAYLLLMAIYNLLVGVFLARRLRSGRGIPEKIEAGELVLVGVATHKLSRVIGKDRVTAGLRAPFTEFQQEGGPAEVEEKARGTGLRRAIGQLLICPFCLAQWIGTAFLAGLTVAPRTTRFICSIFAVTTISDFLQVLYRGSEEKLLR